MKRSEMPTWGFVRALPKEASAGDYLPMPLDWDDVVPYTYKTKAGTVRGFHAKYMRSPTGIITHLHPGFKDLL